MNKFLYPPHATRCVTSGPSNVGKSVFIKIFFSNFTNQYNKIYIYSPFLHQDMYQKQLKCFSSYLPLHIIPKSLNEEDIDLVNDEIFNNKDFQKSDTEIETYESIVHLKFPQEHETGGIFILDDFNEKERNDP